MLLAPRDPLTGEIALTGELRPRDAATLIRLRVDLEDGLASSAEEPTASADSTEALPHRRPDGELSRLLALIDEQPQTEEENVDVPE